MGNAHQRVNIYALTEERFLLLHPLASELECGGRGVSVPGQAGYSFPNAFNQERLGNRHSPILPSFFLINIRI
jgi:hypothetical protein